MTTMEPLVPPYSPEVQTRFETVVPPGVEPLLLFRVMAKSERAWNKLIGGSMLDPGPLTLRQREIIIDRTCALAGCEYEWGVHVALFAKAAGLRAEEISATIDGDPFASCWSPSESALIEAANSLFHNGKLSSAELDNMLLYYDEEAIVEIIQLAGYYRTISYLIHTFDLPLERFGARFDTKK